MSYKENQNELQFMEGQTLCERSDCKESDAKRRKPESLPQTTPSSPTNGKTLRGFVKGCKDNCLAQNEVKQSEAVNGFSGSGMN